MSNQTSPDPAADAPQEPKTLAAARELLATERAAHAAALATAEAATAAAVAERDALQAQFDAATTAAAEANQRVEALTADLTAAQADVARITADLATSDQNLTTATGNVTRLEALCGVRGIDPAAAIPVIPSANSTPDPVAEYRAACEAKDWKRASEIYSANKNAIWASRVG
jgi:hypothetical protein